MYFLTNFFNWFQTTTDNTLVIDNNDKPNKTIIEKPEDVLINHNYIDSVPELSTNIITKPEDVLIDQNYVDSVENKSLTDISQFDPKTMNKFSSILIIGPARSGKTKLIKNLMNFIDFDSKFDSKIIFDLDIFFTTYMNLEHNSLLVFDEYRNKKLTIMIRRLIFNHRHYRTSFIFSIQSSLDFPDELKKEFDYIFVLKNKYTCNIHKLVDTNMSSDEFQLLMDKYTNNYGCIVKDNTKSKIFHYKAT